MGSGSNKLPGDPGYRPARVTYAWQDNYEQGVNSRNASVRRNARARATRRMNRSRQNG